MGWHVSLYSSALGDWLHAQVASLERAFQELSNGTLYDPMRFLRMGATQGDTR